MAYTIVADLDTMVFEDRERRYGAFHLRKQYPRSLMIGTFLVVALAAGATFGPLLYRAWFPAAIVTASPKVYEVPVGTIPPPPPLAEDTPPIQPPPPTPPPVKTVAFNIPIPVPEDQVEDSLTINDLEILKKAPRIDVFAQEGSEDIFFTGELEEAIPAVIVEEEDPDMYVFIVPEEEPSPVNLDEIKKLIGYPRIAMEANIEGMVVARILVDKRGHYKKHQLIKSAHPILDREVVKELHRLKFTPAIQGGKPISFWVNVPFRFELLN